MPVHQVRDPQGRIHEIEAPEGATQEQVIAYAQANMPKEENLPKINQGRAFSESVLRAIPFGTDIKAGIKSAILQARGADTSFAKQKKQIMSEVEAAREQYPKTAFAGEIAGGFVPMMAIPLGGASVLSRALQAGVLAGAQGFGYGAQEGENWGDRIGSGIYTGATSAPFGALGSVGADLLTGAGGAITSKAKEIVNRRVQPTPAPRVSPQVGGQSGSDIIEAVQAPLRQNVDASLMQGARIPLTKGQMTQDPRLQALEFGASGGQYGDEAQRLIMEARELQSGAAKSAVQDISGGAMDDYTPFAASEKIQETLKSAYASARAKTTREYQKLGELADDPLKIGAEYVKEGMVPVIKEWARKGSGGTGFDLTAPGMENAKRLYQQASAMGDIKSIKAVNFERMQQWRSRVSQGIANAKMPAEKAFLAGMMQRYDDAIQALPREAIKSGDGAIVDQWFKAIATRANQGKLFERNTLVADILEKDTITNEQFANLLFSKRGDAPLRLEAIMKAVGPKSEDVRQAAKSGLYASVLKKSMSSELKQGQIVEEMVSFDKLATNLKNLVNDNPTMFKMIHKTEAERAAVQALLSDVQKIKSVKPGSKNYSNTAYTVLKALRQISPATQAANVPFVGSAGGIFAEMGNAGATQELAESLKPVLQQTMSDLEGGAFNFAEKYGRRAIVFAYPASERQKEKK